MNPDFIEHIGCGPVIALPRDMSSREYFRGLKDGRPFVAMHYMEEDAEGREKLRQFMQIGQWLNAQGAKAPAIYEVYEQHVFALIEDFGDVTFGKALRKGIGPERDELYTLACDVLRHLKDCDVPEWLPPYRESVIHHNRRQIIEYYVPLIQGKLPSNRMMADYLAVWDKIEQSLPPCPQGFLHVDYHLDNLMWLPQEEGIKQCGLLDFQDALHGPLPYDLVNLLEDARVDVPETLQEAMIARYCDGMKEDEKTVFLDWYRVMGTQFHCRVIGLFIKQAAEKNRDDYLIHINRMQNYINTRIESPLLAPLKEWFIKEGIDFLPISDLNGDDVRELFRRVTLHQE